MIRFDTKTQDGVKEGMLHELAQGCLKLTVIRATGRCLIL